MIRHEAPTKEERRLTGRLFRCGSCGAHWRATGSEWGSDTTLHSRRSLNTRADIDVVLRCLRFAVLRHRHLEQAVGIGSADVFDVDVRRNRKGNGGTCRTSVPFAGSLSPRFRPRTPALLAASTEMSFAATLGSLAFSTIASSRTTIATPGRYSTAGSRISGRTGQRKHTRLCIPGRPQSRLPSLHLPRSRRSGPSVDGR